MCIMTSLWGGEHWELLLQHIWNCDARSTYRIPWTHQLNLRIRNGARREYCRGTRSRQNQEAPTGAIPSRSKRKQTVSKQDCDVFATYPTLQESQSMTASQNTSPPCPMKPLTEQCPS